MYEIWSVGHKPFESFGNAEVSSVSIALHTSGSCFKIIIGTQVGRHRTSSPPSSWLSQSPLQHHDIMLVRIIVRLRK